ncbi:hypothetical protein ABE10_25415, partial [Bacillus toyonensis]|nr:hypothetical protein [Bacillus toyonensis]
MCLRPRARRASGRECKRGRGRGEHGDAQQPSDVHLSSGRDLLGEGDPEPVGGEQVDVGQSLAGEGDEVHGEDAGALQDDLRPDRDRRGPRGDRESGAQGAEEATGPIDPKAVDDTCRRGGCRCRDDGGDDRDRPR